MISLAGLPECWTRRLSKNSPLKFISPCHQMVLRISSLIKVVSLLARTYGKKRRILGQPPRTYRAKHRLGRSDDRRRCPTARFGTGDGQHRSFPAYPAARLSPHPSQLAELMPAPQWPAKARACRAHPLVLQRHVRQLSMAQVVIFQELKSFLRISIRTWLMDQNPCETSHFLAIGVLTQRWSTRSHWR